MGLDQYLYAKRYASKFHEPELNQRIIELADATDFADTDWGITHLEIPIGYWRKANAIHQWFVDNCQGGEDNCREVYVGRDQLLTLAGICEQILANPRLGSDLLPTQEGFFFGGTEYDEYYLEAVRYTLALVQRIMTKVPQHWDLYYCSSW